MYTFLYPTSALIASYDILLDLIMLIILISYANEMQGSIYGRTDRQVELKDYFLNIAHKLYV
jgi:hypothetical protein